MPIHAPSVSSHRPGAYWAGLALVWLALAVGLCLWLWRTHDLEDSKARARLAAQARAVHDNLGQQLESVDAVLLGIQQHVSQPGGVRSADSGVLELLDRSMPGVRMLSQLNAQGLVLASSRSDWIGRDRSDRLHFQQARANPDPTRLRVSAPYRVDGGNSMMALVHTLRGPDGAFVGLVEAVLSEEHFRVVLSSVLSYSDMTANLLHGSGDAFMRLPATSTPLPSNLNVVSALLRQHRDSGLPSTVVRGNTINGEDRVVAFHNLHRADLGMDTALVVALGRSPQAMLQWWSTLAQRASLLYLAIVLTSGLAMFGLLRRRARFAALAAQQQAALTRSEARFRSLTTLSSDWYWEQDAELRFVELQGGAAQRMHPALRTHVGNRRWDLPALNLTEDDWQKHRDVLAAHQPFREFLIARPDPVRGVLWSTVSGEPIFDENGQFCGYRGTGRDVTEVMQARDDLRRSEERLQLALRGSNDAHWDFDLRSDHYYYSDRWCELLGLDPKDPRLTSLLWRELCHPDDIGPVTELLRVAVEGMAETYEVEARLRHQSGHYVPLMARGYIQRDCAGKAIRISGVSTDLRERKRAEADREALTRAQTEQRVHELVLGAAENARAVAEAYAQNLLSLLAERDRSIVERDKIIRERDQLVGLLAHEVRQPLNNASAALQGALQVTGNEQLSRATATTHLQRAQGVLDQVIDTVNNSLAASTLLARSDNVSLQEFEIDTLIALALADLGPAARGRVSAQRLSPVRTAEINVSLMRLALRNLLVNALAYSPAHLPVSLTVATTDEPCGLVIEVADQGKGISPELLPTLFERGVRGPQSAGIAGAGLGLYVVARVVALHHGTVQVESAQPHGSLFRITLPQG